MAFDILGRRAKDRERFGERLPPGQKVVDDWPVLTYGSTPGVDLDSWTLRLFGAVEEETSFTWQEFIALPKATVGADMHCVTAWSKMDNRWEGVAFKELMKHLRLRPEANAVMAHCYGGY
ncbi:MAG: molybdopterin-dependent oxidoreductase, partial [Dehalococcoidia bacterium]